jgi:hypothetical protein
MWHDCTIRVREQLWATCRIPLIAYLLDHIDRTRKTQNSIRKPISIRQRLNMTRRHHKRTTTRLIQIIRTLQHASPSSTENQKHHQSWHHATSYTTYTKGEDCRAYEYHQAPAG